MDDVRVVGVKLQHIEEVPEHPGHFGSRRLDAYGTPNFSNTPTAVLPLAFVINAPTVRPDAAVTE
jgi:hypothetical protein